MRQLATLGKYVMGLGLLALGLAACSADEGPPPPCPDIYIVADTAKLTRFKPGPGRDIIDMRHEEEMVGFGQSCEYDTDASGAGEVVVAVAPTIVSRRGPANTSGESEFEYFVAITDSQKNIREQARFPVKLVYPSNVPQLRWQRPNPHNLILPLKAGETGRNWRIYLGLQLTRDEVEYKRNTR